MQNSQIPEIRQNTAKLQEANEEPHKKVREISSKNEKHSIQELVLC